MPIQESAITLSSKLISRGGVVKTGDNIPELTDTFRSRLDELIAAGLVQPPFNHRIVAGNHVRVVQSGDVVLRIHQSTFFREGIGFCGVFDFGQFHHSRFRNAAVQAAQIGVHRVIIPRQIVFEVTGVSLIEMILGSLVSDTGECRTDE